MKTYCLMTLFLVSRINSTYIRGGLLSLNEIIQI